VTPNEIGVAVKDGIVVLTGWVDSYTKRWAAEEAAHRVRGVKAVANEIEVRLPVAAERTDADIAATAVRALEWDAMVPVDKLDVTVSKGWVTLRVRSSGSTRSRTPSGWCAGCRAGSKAILRETVRSWAEKEEAERAAWGAPGITAVENRITIAYD